MKCQVCRGVGTIPVKVCVNHATRGPHTCALNQAPKPVPCPRCTRTDALIVRVPHLDRPKGFMVYEVWPERLTEQEEIAAYDKARAMLTNEEEEAYEASLTADDVRAEVGLMTAKDEAEYKHLSPQHDPYEQCRCGEYRFAHDGAWRTPETDHPFEMDKG